MAEPMHVLWLLCATAVVAATLTAGSLALARRNRRRTRGIFVLGVICGVMAGPMLLRRSSGLRAMRTVARATDGAVARATAGASRRRSSRR